MLRKAWGLRPCLVSASFLCLFVLAACVEKTEPLVKPATYTPGHLPDPSGPFAAIQPTPVEVLPAADTYSLPLSIADVENMNRDVRTPGFTQLGDEAETAIQNNGFVALEGTGFQRFTEAYLDLSNREVPLFVTADSVLHLYHLFYSQLLKNVEITEFVPLLSALLRGLQRTAMGQLRGAPEELKDAAMANVAYFTVARRQLDPQAGIPGDVADVVEAETALIEAHERLEGSPLMSRHCPGSCDPCDPVSQQDPACRQCYCEDYSQYVPRGHYTQTEALGRYFKAMMWLGRIGMRMKDPAATIQAVLATDALKFTQVSVGGAMVPASEVWQRIYRVTGFFVGAADDLTFYEYDAAVVDLFGEEFDETLLADQQNLSQLQERLNDLRQPQIVSDFVSAFLEETEETKGLKLMGQRFVPDSYVLAQLVYNRVGAHLSDPAFADLVSQCIDPALVDCDNITLEQTDCICIAGLNAGRPEVCRLLPSGLDVMAAMGNGTARDLLAHDEGYCGYTRRMDDLETEFAGYGFEDWTQNLYWGWLHAIEGLMKPAGQGYPSWMQTQAWKLKTLQAGLASWAQLRHDTILYVKQSYTSNAGTSAPLEAKYYGYVEPVPHFYARLYDLTRLTRLGLGEFHALPEKVAPVMEMVEALLLSLKSVAEKELIAEPLTEEEINAIDNMGDTFEGIVEALGKAILEVSGDPNEPGAWSYTQLMGDPYNTAIVADVHTDGNTQRVLEVASGNVDWIVVVHKLPGGGLGAAVGPMFSYYEFPHPMSDRLTDEAWRSMLADSPPSRPAWTTNFYR